MVALTTGAFQFYDTSWRPILKLFSGSGARAALYYAGSEKLVTSSSGLTVTGTAVATAFSGPLTGNVTGNLTGNAGYCNYTCKQQDQSVV